MEFFHSLGTKFSVPIKIAKTFLSGFGRLFLLAATFVLYMIVLIPVCTVPVIIFINGLALLINDPRQSEILFMAKLDLVYLAVALCCGIGYFLSKNDKKWWKIWD